MPKNRFSAILLAFIGIVQVAASCELHGYYLGINPNYNQHSLSLRYRYASFSSIIAGTHIHPNGQLHTHDQPSAYNTYELWGRFYPHPKVQLLISAPYHHNTSFPIKKGSIGDVTTIAQYQILHTRSDSAVLMHRVFFGGGIKAPTGKYKPDEIYSNLQTGTGSLDFLITTSYIGKYKKFGISADGAYKVTTANNYDYQFAKRLNLNTNVFYQYNKGDVTLIPSTGFFYELAGYDTYKNVTLGNTGTEVIFNGIGVDFYYRQLSLNIAWQVPLYEQSNELLKNNYRFLIGINYALK